MWCQLGYKPCIFKLLKIYVYSRNSFPKPVFFNRQADMAEYWGQNGEGHLHNRQAPSSPVVVDLPVVTLVARSWWQLILAERWISFRKTSEEVQLCYLEKHWLGIFCTLVPSEFYQTSPETSQITGHLVTARVQTNQTNQNKPKLRYGWLSTLPEAASWGKWKSRHQEESKITLCELLG